MSRCVRLKSEAVSWYHVHVKTAGKRGEFPLEAPLCRKKLIELIKHYSSAYCCEVAAFSVMGNHYHAVIRFDEYREMDQEELTQRVLVLYPKSQQVLKEWSNQQWQRLNQRLFDLSELMRNIQAAFAKWYNFTYERRGRFWGDRFSSTLLENQQAVLDCILYVDLNPVRAGLVKRPEDHEGSSIYFRHIGKARWLVLLKEIVALRSGFSAMKEYRYLLYYRGSVPTKPGQALIPEWIIEEEERRGFSGPGVYLKRLRYFTDGVALGSEGFVREHLAKLREAGRYIRRKHPIMQNEGLQASLREQRSHAISF